MNLMQLIRKAMQNPELRLALETGAYQVEGTSLTSRELAAAREALRFGNVTATARDIADALSAGIDTIPWHRD